jgi:hypothetical protein
MSIRQGEIEGRRPADRLLLLRQLPASRKSFEHGLPHLPCSIPTVERTGPVSKGPGATGFRQLRRRLKCGSCLKTDTTASRLPMTYRIMSVTPVSSWWAHRCLDRDGPAQAGITQGKTGRNAHGSLAVGAPSRRYADACPELARRGFDAPSRRLNQADTGRTHYGRLSVWTSAAKSLTLG